MDQTTLAESLTQLVERARQGEPAAVRQLVGRFRGSAQRLAEALIGDAHQAEDVVQEAFITALGRLKDLRTPEAFPGWFRQIVRTEVNRVVRKRTERSSDQMPDEPSSDPPPSEQIEREERRQLIREALSKLPAAGRETVDMYYLQERSIAEVADTLDIPLGTVKRRLFDARKRLRDILLGARSVTPSTRRPDARWRENDLL